MISINHRFSGSTLCEFDVETVRQAVEKAVAEKANLYGANLYGANLYGANLRGADLHDANLDGEKISKTPLSVVGLRYWCLISDGYMRLGCKRFTHQEWADFDDEQISKMDDGALKFWQQWKSPLLAMCKSHAGE